MATREVLAVTGAEGLRLGLVAASFGFGFRHGVDWDHLAALTDITGSQETRRRSMFYATLYALGHALVVFALGLAAIVLAEQLPESVDRVMERVVGVTLIALGAYVVVALARHGRNFRMRSRWMLLFTGVRHGRSWLRSRRSGDLIVIEHEHDHPTGEGHVDGHAADLRTLDGHADADHHHALQVATTTTQRHRHPHVAPLPGDPFLV